MELRVINEGRLEEFTIRVKIRIRLRFKLGEVRIAVKIGAVCLVFRF